MFLRDVQKTAQRTWVNCALKVLAMASPTASWNRPVLSSPVCSRMQSAPLGPSRPGALFTCSKFGSISSYSVTERGSSMTQGSQT